MARRKKKPVKPWRMIIEEHDRNWDKRIEAEEKASLGLLNWGKHYFPHYFRTEFNSVHKWLEANAIPRLIEPYRLRSSNYNVSLIAPRGAAKSTILAFLLPLYSICYNTEHLIMLCSSAKGLAKTQLADIKIELESNKRLIEDFPHVCGAGSVWNKDEIRTKNGVYVSVAGADSQIRGIKHEGRRPSLIIFDDPDPQSAKTSEAMRARSWSFLTEVLIPAGEEKVTSIVVAGTVLHRDCTVEKLDKNPLFQSKRIGAILAEPDFPHLWDKWRSIVRDTSGADPLSKADQFYDQNKRAMNQGALTFWPEQFSYESLQKKRLQIGSTSFRQEYLCKAANSEGYFERNEISENQLFVARSPDEYLRRILVIDPSTGDGADDSAICDGMLGVDRRAYVSIWIDKYKPRQLARFIVLKSAEAFDEGAPFGYVYFESNGFQVLYKDAIEEELKKLNEERAKVGKPSIGLKLRMFNSTDNKELRIQQLERYFAKGQIKLTKTRGRAKLMTQLEDFPNAKNDDGADCLAMTVIRLAGKRKKKKK